MLRMLTLLGTVGVAWALSQYLPSKDSIKQTETTAAIVTRAITVASAPPADQRSVALLDLAVVALGAEPPASDFAPEAAAANTAADRPGVEAGGTIEPSGPELAAVESDLDDEAALDRESAAAPANDPKLTRKIQRELRRVGCLKSTADGVWGSGTERAMRRFSERIDADLPIDGPDAVLLILLEKFDNRACGASCPEGEAPNAQGRCRAAEQTAEAIPAGKTIPEVNVASLAGEDNPESAEETPAEIAELAASDVTAANVNPDKAKPRRAKARIVRTTVARVTKPKHVRIARAVPHRRKTRWALPRYYGLGVANARPARVASAPKKRKRRVGAAAAYRRWMRRSDITMR